ncbi:MAG TPA: S8 family peptidase [Steroidobacteraceae bacterium]|nr:S8 family peptidase [Steroidobacteraceae bacterium]
MYTSVGIAARVLGAIALAGLVSCSAAPSDTPRSIVVADAGTAHSYIVEGDSTESAARAVNAAGGKVVSRLGVIDAVEASLTSAQHQTVLAIQGVKQVTPNSPITTLAAANVRDNFEVGSFGNNDGTHRWYGDWVESNDNNGPYDGKVAIGWIDRGGKRLIIGGNGTIYRRAATPSTASTVTLRFKSSRGYLEAGDYLAVQASANGGSSWTEVGRITGAANDSSFVSHSFNITAFRGRNTAIRFVASMDQSFPGDWVDLDDVEISYTTNYGEGDPTIVDVNAQNVHNAGIRGRDVGVAIVDTGYWKLNSLDKDSSGAGRVAVQYDAVRNVVDSTWSSVSTDTNGHGTHITGLIASSRKDSRNRYFGVAPDARIVSVKAFAEDGSSSYATVIRAIDWVITNRTQYAIRVLNLSLGAPARSRYWDDPLNKAVMRAWQSGIVVVVSAGNSGPLPQTVGVPGNVPYVITVGAMTDSYSTNKNDDRLASFSSTGPTFEGFVKPDLVAPGGHLWSFMATYQKIAVDHPTYMNNGDFFTMSGTSQSAAVVSGVAALVLAANTHLTPDQVKCRIIASAKPAVNSNGTLAYSVLQQGTGLVDAERAVYGTENNCANQGLNITADLNGTQHYMGSVRQSADGIFKVTGPNGSLLDQGYAWDQGYVWEAGYAWSTGYVWHQGYVWMQGQIWPQGYDIPWVDGYPANIGNSVSPATSMSINSWVAPE